jgi:hypothetical protein
VSENSDQTPGAVAAAKQLAAALDKSGQEYALGGALALGFWAQPRGTLDVDVTLFISPKQPSSCVRLLQQIGCDLVASDALASLAEHGFCQVKFQRRRLDVFLPIVPFYEEARLRRTQVLLEGSPVMIWDAETLCVFKMMFFRRRDLADVEQILQTQREKLDQEWVLEQLINLYGSHDPRIAEWKELVQETT